MERKKRFKPALYSEVHLNKHIQGMVRINMESSTYLEQAQLLGGKGVIFNILAVTVLALMLLTGCIPPQPVTDRNSQLTQGNVQLSIQVGETTKAQILESFGAPNVTTRDGTGKEVWTYQRSAQVAQSSSKSGYWTILLAGQSGGSSGFETSSRMITLIIKFDTNDVVSDFSSRTSNF